MLQPLPSCTKHASTLCLYLINSATGQSLHSLGTLAVFHFHPGCLYNIWFYLPNLLLLDQEGICPGHTPNIIKV